MANKTKAAEGNKSQAIRDLLKAKPDIKGHDAVSALAEKGVTVTTSLFYLVKGKMAGMKSQKKKAQKKAVAVATASGNGTPDALATILKVKKLAVDVGGLGTLKGIVDALSQ